MTDTQSGGVADRRDGRHVNRLRTRAKILKATRELLKAGVYRPTVREIAKTAGCGWRVVFDIFGSVPKLLEEAITDGHTREQIVNFVCCFGGPPAGLDDQLAIVKAIVLGR